jgi:hypothetical protein
MFLVPEETIIICYDTVLHSLLPSVAVTCNVALRNVRRKRSRVNWASRRTVTRIALHNTRLPAVNWLRRPLETCIAPCSTDERTTHRTIVLDSRVSGSRPSCVCSENAFMGVIKHSPIMMWEWRYRSTILNYGTRCLWVVSFIPWPPYPRTMIPRFHWVSVPLLGIEPRFLGRAARIIATVPNWKCIYLFHEAVNDYIASNGRLSR